MPVRIIIHDVMNPAQAASLFTGFDRADSVRTTQQMLNASNLSQRVKLSRTTTMSLYNSIPLLMMGLRSIKGSWSDERATGARQVESKMDEALKWQKEAAAYETDISKADPYIKEIARRWLHGRCALHLSLPASSGA